MLNLDMGLLYKKCWQKAALSNWTWFKFEYQISRGKLWLSIFICMKDTWYSLIPSHSWKGYICETLKIAIKIKTILESSWNCFLCFANLSNFKTIDFYPFALTWSLQFCFSKKSSPIFIFIFLPILEQRSLNYYSAHRKRIKEWFQINSIQFH